MVDKEMHDDAKEFFKRVCLNFKDDIERAKEKGFDDRYSDGVIIGASIMLEFLHIMTPMEIADVKEYADEHVLKNLLKRDNVEKVEMV